MLSLTLPLALTLSLPRETLFVGLPLGVVSAVPLLLSPALRVMDGVLDILEVAVPSSVSVALLEAVADKNELAVAYTVGLAA